MEDFKILDTRINHLGCVLLCEVERHGSKQYVTWLSPDSSGRGKYAGHFYENLYDARIDFVSR